MVFVCTVWYALVSEGEQEYQERRTDYNHRASVIPLIILHVPRLSINSLTRQYPIPIHIPCSLPTPTHPSSLLSPQPPPLPSKPYSLSLRRIAAHIRRRLRVHEQRDNQPVQTQHFRKDEDQDHADEEAGLLRGAADAGVADDADCESVFSWGLV